MQELAPNGVSSFQQKYAFNGINIVRNEVDLPASVASPVP